MIVYENWIVFFMQKFNKTKVKISIVIIPKSRTTISQDMQTRFPVQLAFANFLPRIKGNFLKECCIHDTGTVLKIPLYFR